MFDCAKSKLRYETKRVLVKVISKRYQSEYITYISVPVKYGNVTTFNRIPKYNGEEFNVYIEYDKKEYCINNKEIFVSAQIGSCVEVIVNKGYDKKGRIKDIYFS